MMRVLVTQPYVPEYRVALFEQVRERMRAQGARVLVLAGAPSGAQSARSDAANRSWIRPLPSPTVRIAGHEVRVRLGRLPRSDVLVTELDVTNFLAWRALLLKAIRVGPVLVLWGHGGSFVNERRWLGDVLRTALAKRADGVMTYSPAGRAQLVRAGVPEDRVYSIGNSTDTRLLRNALDEVTDEVSKGVRDRFGAHGPTALYVGGLDESKRIGFLLEAARAAFLAEPSFRLILVGDGKDVDQVHAAVTEGVAVHVRVARGEALAEIASICDAVWMPGRVGLVAVDAMALRLPVFTVHHGSHAPEIEFLEEGRTLFFLPDTSHDYGDVALQAMRDHRWVDPATGIPSVERVAERFVDAITASVAHAAGRAS